MAMLKQPPPKAAQTVIRDRIKEFRRVPASELRDNDGNWRMHPFAQRQAIRESLDAIGIADVLIAYKSKKHRGKLTLIDGHGRKEEEPDVEWPTIILDVTDDEADLLMLTLDPMTGMAEADAQALLKLMDSTPNPGTPALADLIQHLNDELEPDAVLAALEEEAGGPGPPEMELQAFEHYDYVVLLYRHALDWSRAKELFEIGEAAFTLRDGLSRKVGTGRVVDGRRVFELLERAAEGGGEEET